MEQAAAEPVADRSNRDVNAGQATKPAIRPLRVWPPIVLLLLMWAMRLGPYLVDEPSIGLIMARFMGPPVMALLILLWWLLFSRATLKEKLLGTVALPSAVAVAWLLADRTVAGFPMAVFAVPWAATAFAVGAICLRRRYLARTAVALVAAIVALGYWDLVRLDEFHGDFKVVENWRWEPTAEDRFLATLASRSPQPAAELPAADASLAESEWPEFRGAGRRGEQPDVVLQEDWDAHPPREIWRVPTGPAWSSFSVAGNRLFTQQQRGEQEAVVCYDARDGSELWAREDESRFWETIGGAGPRGTPTIAEGALYTLGANGLLNRLKHARRTVTPIAVWVKTRRRRGRCWWAGRGPRGGADVEQRVHDRRHHLVDRDRVAGRHADAAVGGADHLAHRQAAAGEGDRAEVAPVVAAGLLVDLRRAAELARDDEQDLVRQSAVLDVADERRDRLVDGRAPGRPCRRRCRRRCRACPSRCWRR